MAEKKVVGPASYFPSIEKKYGKPIEHWMKELTLFPTRRSSDLKRMLMIATQATTFALDRKSVV